MSDNNQNIYIVAAEFNKTLVDAMVDEARSTLSGAWSGKLKIVRVPGAYEFPLVVDAVMSDHFTVGCIVLGYIEKGETLHGEIMGHAVMSKLLEIQLRRKKPMGIGVIGPGATIEQAKARHVGHAKSAANALCVLLSLLETDVQWKDGL